LRVSFLSKMRIILLGMPGSGKTSTAKEIAKQSNLLFIDSDAFIELKYQLKIEEIFNKFGENKFREFEHIALKEILLKDNFILATGGGMPCYNNNIELMNNTALTVYLNASVQTLMNRLNADKIVRPLIKDKTEEEIYKYLSRILKKREQYYNQSKRVINANLTIDEIIKLPIFNY